MIKNIILFVITTVFLVSGQALWKTASAQVSGIEGISNLLLKLFTNIFFLIGCAFYLVATGLWIHLLGQFDYSRIYPIFVGTCVIISLIIGAIFFRENSGIIYKVLGSILIIMGIIVITRA